MNKQTMRLLNSLSFGISIFSLIAAVVYGILRRCCGIELPPFVSDWLLPVLMAASVGYLTNWLASSSSSVLVDL